MKRYLFAIPLALLLPFLGTAADPAKKARAARAIQDNDHDRHAPTPGGLHQGMSTST